MNKDGEKTIQKIEIWHVCKDKTSTNFKVPVKGREDEIFESFFDAVMDANNIRRDLTTQIVVKGSAVYNSGDVEQILKMMGRIL